MPDTSTDRLGRLNRFQVAALALLTSTLAAVGVLLVIRRFVSLQITRPETASTTSRSTPSVSTSSYDDTDQPDVPEAMGTTIPNHFSENLIVPGLTRTGQEILAEDDKDGRSPEGV